MKILSTSTANTRRIKSSLERIIYNWSDDLRINILGGILVITDETTVKSIYSDDFFDSGYSGDVDPLPVILTPLAGSFCSSN